MKTHQIKDTSKDTSHHLITVDLTAHKYDSDARNTYKMGNPTSKLKQTPYLSQNQMPFPFSETTRNICTDAASKLFSPFLTPRSYLSLEQDFQDRSEPSSLDLFHENYRVGSSPLSRQLSFL
uniref:Uncharacterized protein n=1 Tax=Cacopsylla melanoneura TaxID=428564 RepID=A0A8D9EJ70_9HEMI